MFKLEKKTDLLLNVLLSKNIPVNERILSAIFGITGIALIFGKRPEDFAALYYIGGVMIILSVIGFISNTGRKIVFDKNENALTVNSKKFFIGYTDTYVLSEIKEIELWLITKTFKLICTFKDGQEILLNPEDALPTQRYRNPYNLTEKEAKDIGKEISDFLGIPFTTKG